MEDLWPEVITERSPHFTVVGGSDRRIATCRPIRAIGFDGFQWERKHRHALYVAVDGKGLEL